jgi:hypothetical protein
MWAATQWGRAGSVDRLDSLARRFHSRDGRRPGARSP